MEQQLRKYVLGKLTSDEEARLDLAVKLGDQVLLTSARVAYVEPKTLEQGRGSALGLEFQDLDDTQAALLEAFIAGEAVREGLEDHA